MAELKHIAYSLGAKRCSIEISESSVEKTSKAKQASVNAGGWGGKATATQSAEQSSSYHGTANRSGKIIAEFAGTDDVKQPELKWFQHDDTIKRLIEMRCEKPNSIKAETLVLEGITSATMSKKIACAIDGAVGRIGTKGNANMEGQASKEERSKLIFSVEF